jgi:hypothetical protein
MSFLKYPILYRGLCGGQNFDFGLFLKTVGVLVVDVAIVIHG